MAEGRDTRIGDEGVILRLREDDMKILQNCVVDEVGYKWEEIATTLGFSENKIRNIKADNRNGCDCLRETFLEWLKEAKGTGKKERSLQTVLDALTDRDCKPEAAQLMKYYLESRREGNESAITQSPNFFEAMKNLESVYKCPVIGNDWLLKLAKMEFVNLELKVPELKPTGCDSVKDASAVVLASTDCYKPPTLKGQSISLQEILDYAPVQPPRKCILIEGEPGIGKSTLTKQLCYKFAEGTFASEYKLVIRVVLRGLPSDTKLTVEHLVCSCTKDVYTSLDEEDVSTLSQYITANKGKDTLFIMDGYDEFPEELQKSSLVADIINGKAFPQSSFIITSRPQASILLHDKIDRRIEVTGFGEEQIEQFTRNYFGESMSTKADALLSQLKFTLFHIKNICFIPLLLLMTCYVSNFLGMPPETVTKLFQSIILSSVRRHFEKKGEKVCVRSLKNVEELYPQFKKLCALALDGIDNNLLIFDNVPLSEDDHFGLMNCISRDSPFGELKSYHFLHRSFQEFLSACAVKQLPNEQQFKYWKDHLVLDYDQGNWFVLANSQHEMMFRFFCGLGGLKNTAVRDLVFKHLHGSLSLRFSGPLLVIGRAVVEAEDKELYKEIMSHCGSSVTILAQDPHSLSTITQLLSTYSEKINCLEIQNSVSPLFFDMIAKLNFILKEGRFHIDVSNASSAEDFLKGQRCLSSLHLTCELDATEMVLKKCKEEARVDVTEECIHKIREIVSVYSHKIKSLSILPSFEIRKKLLRSTNHLLNLVSHILTSPCPNLTSLHLESVLLTQQDLVILFTYLPKLVLLEMNKCGYEEDDDGFINFAEMQNLMKTYDKRTKCIKEHSCLSEIIFGNDVFTPYKLKLWILIAIKALPRIQKIHIGNCHDEVYSSGYLQCIACCMEHSSSLKSLELLNLSTNDINTFSRVFHNLANSQIEVFSADLPSSSNGYDFSEAVEYGISQCQTLKQLVLRVSSYNSRELTTAVLRGLSWNDSLKDICLFNCTFIGCTDTLKNFADHLGRSGIVNLALGTNKKRNISFAVSMNPVHVAIVISNLKKCSKLKSLIIQSTDVTCKELVETENVIADDLLESVKTSIKESTILEHLDLQLICGQCNVRRFRLANKEGHNAFIMKMDCCICDEWRKIVESILKGAVTNQSLKFLNLQGVPKETISQELIDEVSKRNQKLKLCFYGPLL